MGILHAVTVLLFIGIRQVFNAINGIQVYFWHFTRFPHVACGWVWYHFLIYELLVANWLWNGFCLEELMLFYPIQCVFDFIILYKIHSGNVIGWVNEWSVLRPIKHILLLSIIRSMLKCKGIFNVGLLIEVCTRLICINLRHYWILLNMLEVCLHGCWHVMNMSLIIFKHACLLVIDNNHVLGVVEVILLTINNLICVWSVHILFDSWAMLKF